MARLKLHRQKSDGTVVELGRSDAVVVAMTAMTSVTGTSLSTSAVRIADQLPTSAAPLREIWRGRDDPTGKLGGPQTIPTDVGTRSTDFTGLAPDTLYTLTTRPVDVNGNLGPATSVTVRTQKEVSTTADRDPKLQPFASTSIWNIPLGVDAVMVDAGIRATPAPGNPYATSHGSTSKVVIDPIHINMNTGDPQKEVSNILEAGLKPISSVNYNIPAGTFVHVPAGMSHNGSWNGIAAFIRPGGETYMEGQTLYLTAGGNPRWAYTNPKTTNADLRGEGRAGMHGGAAMSGLGGAVRRFEWDAYLSKPLKHVLSVNLFGDRFMSRSTHPQGGSRGGWRWPAYTSDSGYSNPDSHNYYGLTGTDKPMMGALLGLKTSFDLNTITHARARWLADALQGFGAYVVDNTAWDAHAFSMEASVRSLFGAESSTFHTQVMSLFSNLQLVVDNSPTNVGGAGARRRTPPNALKPR